jgi:hypothetical protein
MESHLPRKPDPKMTKATNALHRDQISTAQAGIAKSVVGCDTSAEERSGFYGTELIGNGSDATRFSDHHFRITSVRGYSRYHGVLTIHNVSASARLAHSVFAAEEADTDPLTDFPSGHTAAQRFNATNHFMPRNAWQSQTRVGARDRGRIGVTDSACFDPNPDLSRSGTRDGPRDQVKNAGRGYLNSFVRVCHLMPSPCDLVSTSYLLLCLEAGLDDS